MSSYSKLFTESQGRWKLAIAKVVKMVFEQSRGESLVPRRRRLLSRQGLRMNLLRAGPWGTAEVRVVSRKCVSWLEIAKGALFIYQFFNKRFKR